MDVSYLWLIAAAAFFACEVFGLSGIGFLFAGLAAIGVAIVAEIGVVTKSAYIAQFAWFFLLTAVFALLLWKPMRKMQTTSKDKPYSNIVGDTATVGDEPLRKGQTGTARWSGTIMQAELSPHAPVDELEPGTIVKILSVSGTKLIVDIQRH